MAFSNFKSNPIQSRVLSSAIFITFLLLQYHNVESQASPTRSENVAFSITQFEEENIDIITRGDATISGGILRLTKTDQYGKPLPNSVGRATYATPIHIWDKTSGELADFSTGFSFIVNTNDEPLHGDGFAFFIGPVHFDLLMINFASARKSRSNKNIDPQGLCDQTNRIVFIDIIQKIHINWGYVE
ncbi:lectin [Trifolium medium]|uniref:Lectin n=1 Tax=Trifolium medium TaxID=97028 RepID=A0A392M4W7_9FABA|nr:lectin [Trifolium medium]